MNQKGISMMSLIITIIIMIILAGITVSLSGNSATEANEGKFKNDLKNVVTAVESYHTRADAFGVSSYKRNNLAWDGVSEKAENTAKMEDKSQAEEDSIRFILSGEIPNSLDGIMKIEAGEVVIDESQKTQIEWARELYHDIGGY